jgi:hypothetical protein
MKLLTAKTALTSLILLTLSCFSTIEGNPINSQNDPEAYLQAETSTPTIFYVEVYMHQPLAAGQDISAIRASLRDTVHTKLISTTVSTSSEGNSNFRIVIPESEAAIVEHLQDYVVLVDAYPTAGGNVDAQLPVSLEVSWKLETNSDCLTQENLQVNVIRDSDHPYAIKRMKEIVTELSKPNAKSFISAQVKQNGNVENRTVRSFGPVTPPARGFSKKIESHACISFAETPPAGESEIQVHFNTPVPLELRSTQTAPLTSASSPDATSAERGTTDFLDLGLTLTSSVANETQEDETVRRERTTRGALDLWFAPVLNKRTVGARELGGWVQEWTPFYIDAKVATGKITADTLALNTINLGSLYEFRHYLNTEAYPDLLRHALTFKHTSDRDFKQDEFKFTYEFQPIFGRINRPIGSAPNLLRGEIVENDKDRFGLEIIPIVGIELGRTYRVRDPKEFEDVSRNLRRFYFGADMAFDFTKFVRLELSDRYYVNGEDPDNRTRNYFLGSLELPLAKIDTSRVRAHHALFLSFERGDQPPFANPGVNVLKFGYRIRSRGIFNR